MKYAIAGCIIFLIGCGEVKEKPVANSGADSTAQTISIHTSSSKNTSLKNDTLKVLALESFKDLPEEIAGCSGLYKATNCKEACNYLLATDLQGNAFIKVGGRFVSLKRTRSSITDKKTKERYLGEGFTITIEVYPVKQTGDEVWEYYGELKLIKDDLKISESITGGVGCK